MIVDKVVKFSEEKFLCSWSHSINRIDSTSGRGCNKLRTYCSIKSRFGVENYCKMIMPFQHRAASCKFR